MPEDWVDESYYESEGHYVAIFRDEFGRPIKKSDITRLKKEYEASLRNKVSSAKRKKTMEEGAELIEVLKEEQNIQRLDGSKNYEHAKRLKNAFYEHLVGERQMHPLDAEERLTEEFRGFLRRVRNRSEFHWNNMTSMGYVDRNFNKITRDING